MARRRGSRQGTRPAWRSFPVRHLTSHAVAEPETTYGFVLVVSRKNVKYQLLLSFSQASLINAPIVSKTPPRKVGKMGWRWLKNTRFGRERICKLRGVAEPQLARRSLSMEPAWGRGQSGRAAPIAVELQAPLLNHISLGLGQVLFLA